MELSSLDSSSALPHPPSLSYDKASRWLLHSPNATVQPSNRRAPRHHFPTPLLPSQPSLQQRCPGNCFCLTEPAPATAFESQSVQVHFCLCCQGGTGWWGGGEVGEGGGLGQGKGNRDVWFSSNPLKHAHTIKCPNQKVEKVVQKLCLFLFFAPFKCDISKVKTCLSILSGS